MSGGGTGTSKDQLKRENDLVDQQLAQQKEIRDQIMKATSQYTTGAGQGYDPAQFSAMISQFLNQNSANYNQAGQSVMSSLAARGAGTGQIPVGGDYTRGLEDLQAARATSQSQGILGANIDNLQQALTNKFNALGLQSGQGAQLGSNIATFNSGASNALNDYVQASSNGFMSQFAKGLGGGIGAGIGAGVGNGFSGGITNIFGKIPGFGSSTGSGAGAGGGGV